MSTVAAAAAPAAAAAAERLPPLSHARLGMSAAEFRRRGHEMVDLIADYFERLESDDTHAVLSSVAPGFVADRVPATPPQRAESFDAVVDDVRSVILPGVTHWQSPKFFAYYPANTSFPSILGEMLAATVSCIGFSWVCSPACTELETRVTDWFATMLELPERFHSRASGGGVIQGSASDAVLVAMVAARTRAQLRLLKRARARDADAANSDADAEAIATPLAATADAEHMDCRRFVAYASDQAHYSVGRAANVIGCQLRQVSTAGRDARMRGDALDAAMRADRDAGLVPFFVAATIGSTSTGAIDALDELGDVARGGDAWLHVDSAYVGALSIVPEVRRRVLPAGALDAVDSYNFNCHKGMLTNFDCSLLFVASRTALFDALSSTPEYLRNRASESGAVTDYRDWQIPLGRRFRSLKLWFVVRSFGVDGLQAHARRQIDFGDLFAQLAGDDARFAVFTPRGLGLTCVRVRVEPSIAAVADRDAANATTKRLMDAVNSVDGFFLTHTIVEGDYLIRFVAGSPLTDERHVRACWSAMQRHTDALLAAATKTADTGAK